MRKKRPMEEYPTLHGILMEGVERSKFRVKGERQGIELGQRKSIETVLRARFGQLPRQVLTLLNRADGESLTRWLPIAVTAPTLEAAVQQFTLSEAVH